MGRRSNLEGQEVEPQSRQWPTKLFESGAKM